MKPATVKLRGGFTLVEVLVAAGITALITGFIAAIVASVSTSWSRSSTRLGTDAQARLILDQIQLDLQGAIFRDDGVVEEGARASVVIGRHPADIGKRIRISLGNRVAGGDDATHILHAIQPHGAVVERDTDCVLQPAPADGVFPEAFYSTTHLPTDVRLNGAWIDVEGVEMDLGIKVDSRRLTAKTVPMADVREGDLIVTGQAGVMDYTAKFAASATGKEVDFVLSVIVGVTTLCPCSKAISKHGAHNQRGNVTVSIRSGKVVWIEDLIALVESSASSELYSLLKRPDEKAVTERAYENPVFVEDLVRNVALKLNAHPDVTWYRVEAENYESIHNHNAYACIEKG